MQTIDAVYQGGVFMPKQSVDLKEGAHVVLLVELSVNSQSIPIIPDPPYESCEMPAPFELPLASEPVRVRAGQGSDLLPDPSLGTED